MRFISLDSGVVEGDWPSKLIDGKPSGSDDGNRSSSTNSGGGSGGDSKSISSSSLTHGDIDDNGARRRRDVNGKDARGGDAQTRWLASELASSPQRTLLVGYHYGLYPSRPDQSWMSPIVTAMRAAWAPLFDAAHVSLAFENHYHTFKTR